MSICLTKDIYIYKGGNIEEFLTCLSLNFDSQIIQCL